MGRKSRNCTEQPVVVGMELPEKQAVHTLGKNAVNQWVRRVQKIPADRKSTRSGLRHAPMPRTRQLNLLLVLNIIGSGIAVYVVIARYQAKAPHRRKNVSNRIRQVQIIIL